MSMIKSKAVEGAGLGAIPQSWDAPPQGNIGARSLDALAARFDADREYTKAEALHLIRRSIRCPREDHASQEAVLTSLLAVGGLVSTEWRLGPVKVKQGDISTPRTRRKATRTQYEQVMNETGDWIACPRDQAPAMRRRVQLFNLDLQDREAERLALQRQQLREQVALDAAS